MHTTLRLSQWGKESVLILMGIITMIFFEASQQYYYVLQFNLVEPSEVSFWHLLQGQAWRWLFWIFFSIPLVIFVFKNPIDKYSLSVKALSKYLGFISFLLILNIITIAFFQLFINKEALTVSNIIEYVTFFTFQKSPIYLISFIGLVIIVHFILNTEILELKMKELSSLKEKQIQLYEELKSKSYADSSPIIEVKIGTRLKYVPLDTISWIEADDYCVKLHDLQNQSYTLRTSLKALESELPNSFVRVHRKAIVNLEKVKVLLLSDQPRLLLCNDIEVVVAHSRLKEVKESLSGSLIPYLI